MALGKIFFLFNAKLSDQTEHDEFFLYVSEPYSKA